MAETMIEQPLDVSERLLALEQEIEVIRARNRRVELDKAWETSALRIVCILVTTYFVVSVVFFVIGVENVLLNAIIPTLAYFLSTRSLPFIKRSWIEQRAERSGEV